MHQTTQSCAESLPPNEQPEAHVGFQMWKQISHGP